jgi:hypothetical protein
MQKDATASRDSKLNRTYPTWGIIVSLSTELIPAYMVTIAALATPNVDIVMFLAGGFFYLQIWLVITVCALEAAAELYGLQTPFAIFTYVRRIWGNVFIFSRSALIVFIFASYVSTIYIFVITYLVLSRLDIGSFNVGRLDLAAAIYFSVSTIATVGFGDIVPVTSTARLIVVAEIFFGLAYAVFLFSIVASFVRESGSKFQDDS